jgi:hypothetical protein
MNHRLGELDDPEGWTKCQNQDSIFQWSDKLEMNKNPTFRELFLIQP